MPFKPIQATHKEKGIVRRFDALTTPGVLTEFVDEVRGRKGASGLLQVCQQTLETTEDINSHVKMLKTKELETLAAILELFLQSANEAPPDVSTVEQMLRKLGQRRFLCGWLRLNRPAMKRKSWPEEKLKKEGNKRRKMMTEGAIPSSSNAAERVGLTPRKLCERFRREQELHDNETYINSYSYPLFDHHALSLFRVHNVHQGRSAPTPSTMEWSKIWMKIVLAGSNLEDRLRDISKLKNVARLKGLLTALVLFVDLHTALCLYIENTKRLSTNIANTEGVLYQRVGVALKLATKAADEWSGSNDPDAFLALKNDTKLMCDFLHDGLRKVYCR